ncbi:SAF domain-containing protein [Nakamurella deserti]|uniref:SAF domain-containing protein n=1 Tax=Nakamurella deserti TaxID=2164074 RepID=UPI000DBE04BE|nr:SAF domain-containing protein [Nakamurella deserti]
MATQAPGRSPRRLTTPRWLDPRVVGGILLVVVAVVVGARVVAASSQTAPIWSAARPLAVGTVLTAGDLEPLDVNLGEAGGRYVSAGSDPVGRTVGTPLQAGELVPAASLGDPPDGRIVVVPVPADKFPPGVDHGSVIDLYLSRESLSGGDTTVETELLDGGLTVQSVTAPSSGGLSGASATQFQVAVLVDARTADELVRTLPQGEAVVVLVAGA